MKNTDNCKLYFESEDFATFSSKLASIVKCVDEMRRLFLKARLAEERKRLEKKGD